MFDEAQCFFYSKFFSLKIFLFFTKHSYLLTAKRTHEVQDDTHMTLMKIAQFLRPLHLLCPITSKTLPLPWPWTSNFKWISLLQMITNQLKENIIQRWLLYVIRLFFQVGFPFQYQLFNLVRFTLTSCHLTEASLSAFVWLVYILVWAIVWKYQKMFFICNNESDWLQVSATNILGD